MKIKNKLNKLDKIAEETEQLLKLALKQDLLSVFRGLTRGYHLEVNGATGSYTSKRYDPWYPFIVTASWKVGYTKRCKIRYFPDEEIIEVDLTTRKMGGCYEWENTESLEKRQWFDLKEMDDALFYATNKTGVSPTDIYRTLYEKSGMNSLKAQAASIHKLTDLFLKKKGKKSFKSKN